VRHGGRGEHDDQSIDVPLATGLEPDDWTIEMKRRSTARSQSRGPISLQSRLLTAAEVAAASFFVFGHNVFQVLPNEVPILFGLGLISYRLRNGGWADMGLVRPASCTRIVVIGLAAAVARPSTSVMEEIL
jgi:hypothetical protein